MDDPISARYVWDVEAMTEGLAAHHYQTMRPSIRYLAYVVALAVGVLFIGVPLMMIVDSRGLPEARRNAVIASVIVVGVIAWFVDAIRNKRFLRWTARRVFKSKPNGVGPVEWSFGPDQLSNRTANSTSTLLWPVFVKVVEAPKGFLLYHSIQLFNWIPGHAFASAQELRRFADLARAKVPHYVVLGECQFPAKPEPIGLQEF